MTSSNYVTMQRGQSEKMAKVLWWVSVEVKRSVKVFQSATIVAAKPGDSFGSLLDRLCSEYRDETIDKVIITSAASKGTTHTVPLCAPVVQVRQSLYVCSIKDASVYHFCPHFLIGVSAVLV